MADASLWGGIAAGSLGFAAAVADRLIAKRRPRSAVEMDERTALAAEWKQLRLELRDALARCQSENDALRKRVDELEREVRELQLGLT